MVSGVLRHQLVVTFLALAFAVSPTSWTSQVPVATAQPKGTKIEIAHQPPNLSDPKTVPAGQAWVPLAVELRNTREINLKVRLVGSRDGRYIDVMLPPGALNSSDFPTYKIELPAPSTSMSYQFVVHQPDGSLTTSRRYSIQRACVQNYRVEVAENDPNRDFKRKVGEIEAKAGSLERDFAYLDAAAKILEDLRTTIPN